jgi:phosphatidylserine/phosphatidylglycerophosphate/cardiolipin synthase-like enzyme
MQAMLIFATFNQFMKFNSLIQKGIHQPIRSFFILLLAGIVCPFTDAKADCFRLLDSPSESFQCRVDLIQQAKQEILVSYYIIKDDEAGNVSSGCWPMPRSAGCSCGC